MCIGYASAIKLSISDPCITPQIPTSPTAMLSDFGSSEARNAINRSHRSGVTGTLDYLAPEAFQYLPNGKPRQHSAELDLWALGESFFQRSTSARFTRRLD